MAKVPLEIYEEIKAGSKEDSLVQWVKKADIEQALRFEEEVKVPLVARATEEGYASDLTDTEVEKIGRDPFLIAYALTDRNQRWVVTTEVSKPRKQRANRHVPDVCHHFGVSCCNTFEFIRRLNFSTSWQNST